MEEIVDVTIPVRYADGHLGSARVRCLEAAEAGSDRLELRLSLEGQEEHAFSSEKSLFDALVQARLACEELGITLLCMGSHEKVYPSPMQESMGVNTLAYKTELGKQATSADVVDIFAPDPKMSGATVREQAAYHHRWLASLFGQAAG